MHAQKNNQRPKLIVIDSRTIGQPPGAAYHDKIVQVDNTQSNVKRILVKK